MIDLIRVQDVGLREEEDPDILEWAAKNNRIVITHDRTTMPDFAYDRIAAGRPMPGLFVFDAQMRIGRMVESLELTDACSVHSEWEGLVIHNS